MKALITGITGQDGSYLAELLLKKGYEVHGIVRRNSFSKLSEGRLKNIYQDPHVDDRKLFLYYGDLVDSLSIDHIVHQVKPNEVYHLGAQSHVRVSFDVPKYTGEVDALGTLHLLEAIRKHCSSAKFYNASTSELYGKAQEFPQTENTPFYPRSPYGIAKLYSFWITKNYKEAYNIFAVNGILFNHESERRGSTFVTKKITEGLIKYITDATPFYLGNLNAKRDWGYAPEFVEAMWLMLQQDKPEDFVISTGETHTIQDFIEECLKWLRINKIPIEYEWKNNELWDKNLDQLIIGIDPKYYRPSEVDILVGDSSKAKEKLCWEPKTKFSDLVKLMIEYELNNYYEKN